MIAGAELSPLARAIFSELLDQLSDLDRRLKKLDATMISVCRTNATCRRLAKLPGVGPVVATAIVAAVNDGRQFRSGREMAAWIGLASASPIYDRRQAAARRYRTSRQPLPQASNDTRCARRRRRASKT
jgi:transposase